MPKLTFLIVNSFNLIAKKINLLFSTDAAEFSLRILELFNSGYLRDCAKYANLSHLCVRNHQLTSSAMKTTTKISRTQAPIIAILLVQIIINRFWLDASLYTSQAITTTTRNKIKPFWLNTNNLYITFIILLFVL